MPLLRSLGAPCCWDRRKNEFLTKLPIGMVACSASLFEEGYVQLPMLMTLSFRITASNKIIFCFELLLILC